MELIATTELKSTKEVSEITGLTQGYIAELCAASKVPGVIKKGKMWLIPEASIIIINIITGNKKRADISNPAEAVRKTLAEAAVSQAGEAIS